MELSGKVSLPWVQSPVPKKRSPLFLKAGSLFFFLMDMDMDIDIDADISNYFLKESIIK